MEINQSINQTMVALHFFEIVKHEAFSLYVCFLLLSVCDLSLICVHIETFSTLS